MKHGKGTGMPKMPTGMKATMGYTALRTKAVSPKGTGMVSKRATGRGYGVAKGGGKLSPSTN